MNKEEILSSLSKGVPNDVSIEISREELVRLSDNKEETRKTISNYFEKLIEKLAEESTPFAKLVGLCYTLMIYTDDETLDNKICISDVAIKGSIYLNLNVSKSYYRALKGKNVLSYNEEKAKERLELLKSIRSNNELQKEFPILYSMFKSLLRARTMLENDTSNKNIAIDEYDVIEIIKNIDFNSFINLSSSYFEMLINDIKKFTSIANDVKIDIESLKDIDKDKLELYIANSYLSKAENETDKSDIQKCLYYVSCYFFENKDRIDDETKLAILTSVANISKKEKEKTLTRRILYERYQELLKKNPEIRNITFSKEVFKDMTLEEINGFMQKYFSDLMANWEILPHGDDSFDKDVKDNIKKMGKNLSKEEKEEKERKLLQLFTEKKEFYDSSNYAYRIKGRKTFDGYIGYIYPNGIVVLDKYYENAKKGILAEDEAIYCMDINDFYSLSQFSKTILIREKLCTRFIHQGSWQKRIKKEIDTERENDLVSGMKKLIKTGNVVKSDN